MKRIFLSGHILSTAGDAFSLMIDPYSVNAVLAPGGGAGGGPSRKKQTP